ncbi:MAG: PA domain-containing protein [Bacteroidota bacterium]
MKRFFTLTLFFTCCAVGLSGQVAFRVDAPAEQAGLYTVVPASFGGSFDFDFSGEVVIVDDGSAAPTEGCNALTNDLTGKIALVDRGTCQFGTKSLNAQNAGAIAVIICNNRDNDGAIGMSGGDDGGSVTIPVVSLSKEDCAVIRMGVPELTVSFLTQFDPNEIPVWGSTEGRFTNGIGDWTTQGISGSSAATAVWEHVASASAEAGGFSSAADAIASPSSNDGAMIFNSDFLDNGGDSTMTNMGPSPAPHSGELISPTIDLSMVPEVSLRFNQLYRNRNSTTSVAFSTDDGATWSDPIQVNEEVGTEQATAARSIQTIYLPGLGGSSTAKVKFIFEGSLYYWIIDDVKLIEAELYSSSISAFLFPPSNYGTPVTMIEGDSLFFSTLVNNNGLQDLSNVKLTGQVIGGENNILYEDSAKLTMVESGRVDTSLFIDGGYEAPGLDVGTYIARYTLEQDNAEYSPEDNIVNLPFEVTENTFQKDDGVLVSGIRSTANTAYEYGNLYFVPNDGYKAIQATFSVALNQGTDLTGQTYTIKLYKIEEDDDPSQFTDDDVMLVGLANETFPDDLQSFALYTVDLLDFNTLDPGVPLEGGSEYLLMFTYAGTDDVFTTYTNVAYGNRVTDVLRVEGGQGGPWFTGGFTGDLTPLVRMHIDQASSTTEAELAADQFKLFPNPTVDQINVDLKLEELSPNVEILIRDLSGRTVQQYNYENVIQDQFSINTSDLQGMYIMTIRTNQGVKSEKFMVLKAK